MAALFLMSFVMCLSRQFTDAFSLPPTNHRANGGFQSRTLSHSFDHTRLRVCSAQNFSVSFAASFAAFSSLLPGLILIFILPLSSYSLEGVDKHYKKKKRVFKSFVEFFITQVRKIERAFITFLLKSLSIY